MPRLRLLYFITHHPVLRKRVDIEQQGYESSSSGSSSSSENESIQVSYPIKFYRAAIEQSLLLEIKTHKKNIETLTSEIKTYKNKLEKLQAHYSKKKGALAFWRKKVGGLASDKLLRDEKIEQQEGEISTLKGELKNSRDSSTLLSVRANNLQLDVSTYKSRNKSLEEELDRLREFDKQLQTELEQQQTVLEVLYEEDIEKTKKHARNTTTKNSELRDLKCKINGFTLSIAEKNSQITTQEEKLKSLKKELDISQKEAQEIKGMFRFTYERLE